MAARSMGRAVGVLRRWCGAVCLACCGGWLRSVLRRDVWRSRGFGCEKVSLVCAGAATFGPGCDLRVLACGAWRLTFRADNSFSTLVDSPDASASQESPSVGSATRSAGARFKRLFMAVR